MDRPYSLVDEGVRLHVLATPKSKIDEMGTVKVICVEGAPNKVFIRAKVRALPDKGLANKALIKLVAKWVGVGKSHVSLVSGARSRQKTVLIAGHSVALGEIIDDLIQT